MASNEVGCINRVVESEDECKVKDSITLKRHKELTDLSYKVKDFIELAGGVKYHESCEFGRMMEKIIHLK